MVIDKEKQNDTVHFRLVVLREIGSNGEIGIRSIDAKITQTANPIVNQDNRIVVLIYLLPYSSQTTILKCTVYLGITVINAV